MHTPPPLSPQYGGEDLPALLGNLASRVETHKIVDGYKLFKASDIGQMLQVFESEGDRAEAAEALVRHAHQGFHCSPSGLTPPMHKVVERKWLHRFNQSGPFKRAAVRQVCSEIVGASTTLSGAQHDDMIEVHVTSCHVFFVLTNKYN